MFDKNTTQPLHVQLERALLQKIESGVYCVGDAIPKEMELVEQYGVSRITVRRALQSLTDSGYLKRIKHKGTFVQPCKVEEPLLKIQSFTQETLRTGRLPTTRFASVHIESVGIEAARELRLCADDAVLHIERVRCIEGVPVVLFDTYMPSAIALTQDCESYYGSLYALLQQHGIAIKKIRQHMGAAIADARLTHYLPCTEGDAVLVLRRTGFSQTGEAVEYTVGRYLGDRYEYYFELDETGAEKYEQKQL